MKPICVPCQRFYRPKENGFYFVEGMPSHNGAKPGLQEPESWSPYKLWCGDKWECPDCGASIIVGTGMLPLREQHHDDFREMIDKLNATLQIKDC